MKTIPYLNLTNGIEAISAHELKEFRFIRIQSTACEAKKWNKILIEIDHDFLMNAAIGNTCLVFDYGARKPVPRAIWQGLEWIKFVLNKEWAGETYKPQGRAERCLDYFEKEYLKLSDDAKKKIRYYKNFYCGKINIVSRSGETRMDGQKDFYRKILTGAI